MSSIVTAHVQRLVILLVLAVAVHTGSGGATGTDTGLQDGITHTRVASPQARLAKIRVVDHNIQRKSAALNLALKRARRDGAQFVALQEVCWWQARQIRARHPRWTVAWKPDDRSERCRRESSLTALADRGRTTSGNLAIWTGGDKGRTTTHTFRSQGGRRFHQGLACVHLRGAVRYHFCSTHLIHDGESRKLQMIQFRQARHLRRITQPWIDRDGLVVVAGDFNAAPANRTLNMMYEARGSGSFVEATPCPADLDVCRRALRPTFDRGKSKIDYIFFSASRLVPGGQHMLRIQRSPSDHHLLSGWADVYRR